MLQLDREAFLRALAALPEEDPEKPAPFGEGYLITHFVLPFLNGQAVPLRGVDFDAFDEDDIRCIEQRIEVNDGRFLPVRTVLEHMRRCRPSAANAVPFV